MTMSSEASVTTSTGSRIRQFGLYRSIDARTEEFLRLSRKRQIKQGCACAAISTTITVTVVITVFFVYMEYGMNKESNQQSLGKSAWIGLINDSLASTFEEKFSKNKINFDRATIKILPILIKALKQNRYLEKILDDYSSSSPAYDGKVTTEFSFKKDIFLNTRKLVKKPTSRYTIEYKTSPIVFVKNPHRDVGYFTRVRKIREYKRIMDYIEKMISDKVGISSTNYIQNIVPDTQTEKKIKKSFTITEKPQRLKPKNIKKTNIFKKVVPKIQIQEVKKENVGSCNCPKHLSVLLNKIFSSIQHLIPDSGTGKKQSFEKPTNDMQKTAINKTMKAHQSVTTTRTSTTIKPYSMLRLSEFDNIYPKNYDKTTTTFVPDLKSDTIAKNKNLNTFPTTTTNNYLEPTVIEDKERFVTQPMIPLAKIKEIKEVFTSTTEEPFKLLNTNTKKPQIQNEPKIEPSTGKAHIFDGFKTSKPATFSTTTLEIFSNIDEYQDESLTIAPDIVNNIKNYNIHGIELLKSKLMTPVKRLNTTSDIKANLTDKLTTTGYSNNSKQDKYTQTDTKITQTADIYSKNTNDEEFHPIPPDITLISPPVEPEEEMSIVLEKSQFEMEKDNNKNQPLVVSFDKTDLEDEIEKLTHVVDYPHEEYSNALQTSDSTFVRNGTKDTHHQTQLNDNNGKEFSNTFKSTKNNELYSGIPHSSMLPHSRPTYLEIHRNNWKHEDPPDYDTNMKYNVFDLL